MDILGVLTLGTGYLLMLAGCLFFLIAAFRQSVWWGLGSLFLPVVSLVFLIVHWARAKNSFFLQLWGIAFVVVAAVVLHANVWLLQR